MKNLSLYTLFTTTAISIAGLPVISSAEASVNKLLSSEPANTVAIVGTIELAATWSPVGSPTTAPPPTIGCEIYPDGACPTPTGSPGINIPPTNGTGKIVL